MVGGGGGVKKKEVGKLGGGWNGRVRHSRKKLPLESSEIGRTSGPGVDEGRDGRGVCRE